MTSDLGNPSSSESFEKNCGTDFEEKIIFSQDFVKKFLKILKNPSQVAITKETEKYWRLWKMYVFY